MSVLVLDTETTGATNGTNATPFNPLNRLCLGGFDLGGSYDDYLFEYYPRTPYGDSVATVQRMVDSVRLLVGFNIKFDLHWLRRYGIDFSRCNVWDCQLAYFILTSQKHRLPSLDRTAADYGFSSKLDRVRNEYWNNGIDTDEVPLDILLPYLKQDVNLTKQIWLHQLKLLEGNSLLRKCIWASCQDLMVTQEMEYNGLKFDFAKAQAGANQLRQEIAEIDEKLNKHVPISGFNWNSGEHLSAFLFGGIAKIKERERFLFKYKDGREAWKERWVIKEYVFPRLVEPLEGTELAKEGYYSTSASTLQILPKRSPIGGAVSLLLKRAELEQRVSTYYEGWPKLAESMGWEDGYIHSNLNHCITGTSRLSSSKPNMQNMDKEFLECITTRF
jgi:DNA polymerase I-like protein with 3'-5' exonuclease and polymerase domains